MEKVSRSVVAYLETDDVMREALARKVVNLRALARWLIERRGVVGSEAAVLSALRRYRPGAGRGAYESARSVLDRSHVSTRARMCAFTLPKVKAIQAPLGALLQQIDYTRGDHLRILEVDKALRIVIDEENLPLAQQVIPPGLVTSLSSGMVEIDVVGPPEAAAAPGMLALVCNALALRGINVEAFSGIQEVVLLVPKADSVKALQALTALVGSGRGGAAAETR